MPSSVVKPVAPAPINRRHPLGAHFDVFYPFSENTGEVVNDTCGNPPLQDLLAQIASPTWRTTRWGPALDLDGTNDQLDIPGTSAAGTLLDYMGEFTLLALAEFDTFATNTRTLVCRRTSAGNFQWQFRSNTSSRLELLCGGGTIAPTGYTLNTGQGYVCGVTRGPVNTTIYIDGISVGSAANQSLTHRNLNVSIGNAFGISAALNGAFAGLAMSHKCFTDVEMQRFADDPWECLQPSKRYWVLNPSAAVTGNPYYVLAQS